MSVPLTGLSIQIPSTLYAGQVIQAIVLLIPANTTETTITWSVDLTNLATVDEYGVVTVANVQVFPVSFNLTITNGNYSESVNIDIIPAITSMTFALAPTVNTSIGYVLSTITSVTWNDSKSRPATITYSSSNPSSALVDSNGIVSIVGSGSTMITASTDSLMTQYASTLINVNTRPNIATTKIIEGYIYVGNIYVNKITRAYLVVYPYDVEITTTVWSCSDPSVAAIDASSGQITGISNGNCIITALIGNSENSISIKSTEINCTTLIDSIVLTPPSILGLQINGIYTSTISGVMSLYPDTATLNRPFWTSLDPTIATVDTNYTYDRLIITGVSNGTTGISVVSLDNSSVSTIMNVSVENGLNSITTNSIPNTLNISQRFQMDLVSTLGTNGQTAYYSAIEWSSSIPDVATISSEAIITTIFNSRPKYSSGGGLITALSTGTTDIRVNVKGQSGSVTSYAVGTLTVTIGVNSIVISPANQNLEIDASMTLTSTIFPANTDNKSLTWSSSNSAIVSVDQGGIITGVASGTAIITATAQDGSNVFGYATVNVGYPITEAQISISTTTLYIGEPLQASVITNPSDTSGKIAIPDFTYWNPSSTAITSYEINTLQQLTDTGLVIPGALGTSTFTASVGNQYGETRTVVSETITILSPVKAIVVNPLLELAAGATVAISATVYPLTATLQTIDWLSFSDSIASVDSSGNVTGNSLGTTYIRGTTTDGTNISVNIVVHVI